MFFKTGIHLKTAIWLRAASAILMLLCASLSGYARGKDSTGVGTAFHQLHTAMLSPDAATLRGITHSKLSYGHSSGAVDNQQQFVEKLVSGQSVFKSIDTRQVTYTHTGNVVLVRYRLFAETNDGGKPGKVDLLVLLVFKQYKQRWLLLARQAVKPPLTN